MGLGVLSKLGTKSVNFTGTGGGGISDINSSDVAAALSFGLSTGASSMGLWMFLDDDSSKSLLRLLVVAKIKRKDPTITIAIANNLAGSVLSEFSGLLQCNHCNGSGKRLVSSENGVGISCKKFSDCPNCEGAGVKQWADHKRAKDAGINDRTYARRYAHARAEGYSGCCSWLTELNIHLSCQLSNNYQEAGMNE